MFGGVGRQRAKPDCGGTNKRSRNKAGTKTNTVSWKAGEEMRTLEFVVNGQEIKKKQGCDFSGLVSNTKGYLKAKFDVSSDWNGCGIVVIFQSLKSGERAVKVVQGVCVIPDEVLTGSEWSVRLVGVRTGYRITTNKCVVAQERVKPL